ncbi:MAG: enoyl-CoA hydratase [Euryarchaeota archaeon]|nr:enoyl-CoA hydratase [Euryarchaeota archaeon]MDE1835496.1 enoyl-CoA hydratase [Euryarchaeota archaeon]MDE1880389.1 enoyl-CoA hydratase [Euryarchaeota archaeon]MDE2045777.1 enoyl-CoA hydratase [Thermoplasmata archaeon]
MSTAPRPPTLEVGQTRTVDRTFTVEEVESFAHLSGDRGDQHLLGDQKGRRMVHGLLVGSLPTQIGGEMNFLAREITFEFLRPAFTGELLRCTVATTLIESTPKGTRLEATFDCTNPRGELVMKGRVRGLVPAQVASPRP